MDDAWMEQGACRGKASLFFASEDEKNAECYERAKAICRTCEVQAVCLQWALDNVEKWGVWGGTSPRERWKLRTGRETVESLAQNRARRKRARYRQERTVVFLSDRKSS